MAIAVVPLAGRHRAQWESLARGYKAFYETELPAETYQRTWERLLSGERVFALGAEIDGRLVGIVHYLFHPHSWDRDSCYLQDLFVDPRHRGKGVARALVEAVALSARQDGVARLYWLTQQSNVRARRLYDSLARFRGFIRYDYPL